MVEYWDIALIEEVATFFPILQVYRPVISAFIAFCVGLRRWTGVENHLALAE